MDPKKNKKLKENLEFEGEKLGNSYPTENGFLGKSSWMTWEAFPPLFWYVPAKNSKQKLAGNAAKHTELLKKFLFLHRNFYIQKSENEKFIFDLSMIVKSWNIYGNGCSN